MADFIDIKLKRTAVALADSQDFAGTAITLNASPAEEVLRGKWRVAILYELNKGPARQSELRRSIPGITKKVLLENLSTLLDLGVVEKRDLSTKVKRIEYSLTQPWKTPIQTVLAALIGN